MMFRSILLASAATLAVTAGADAKTIDFGAALEAAERPTEASVAASPRGVAVTSLSQAATAAEEISRLTQLFAFSASTQPAERDPLTRDTEFDTDAFKSDPTYKEGYDAEAQIEIYGGKRPVERVTPAIEIGRQSS